MSNLRLKDHTWDAANVYDSALGKTQEQINAEVGTSLAGKQGTLVSGVNIATINGSSILTSGNIEIQGGGSGEDGYSPVVTISNITGGHRVNITDKTHQQGQNFDVMDGAKGDTGDPAPASAVVPAVESWLASNITQETGYVIDTSLTVTGAAADAKKTGDELGSLKSAFDSINNIVELNGFENFSAGGLTFDDSTGAIAKTASTTYSFLLLYNIDYLRIDKSGYNIYIKKISVEDGTFSDTISLQNDINTYEFTGKSHFAIIRSPVSGNTFNLKYHSYSTLSKGEYNKKEFYNKSLKTVSDFTGNSDYFDYASNIRCCTKRIYSNRIKVNCTKYYQAYAYKMENGNLSSAHTWGNNYTVYSHSAEYFVIVVKKNSENAITPEEALNNTDISVSPLSDSPEVIYFTTSVPINGSIYTDHAILVLPCNYSPDGEPVRLCIVCHGADASKYEYTYTQMDETGKILGDPQRVLTKKGYAVLDCYAAPYDYVGNTTDTLGLHYGNPSVVTCYQKAYEYVIKNFNVKNDGILLFASSMGGLSLSQIVHDSAIPVLCCVGYCPCLDMFKQAWCNTWASDQRENIARLFGFEGTAPTWTDGWANLTQAEKDYFYDNISKVIGYYPLLHGTTTGSFDQIKSVMPASKYGDDSGEKAVYDLFRALYEVPFKIIHCADDQTMASRYSEYYTGMLQRNGQLSEIKLYNAGGHSAWAAGEDVTTTDIYGNNFTCKESQIIGFNFASRFDR